MARWKLGRTIFSPDGATDEAINDLSEQLSARFLQHGSGAPDANLDAVKYVDTDPDPAEQYVKIDGTWRRLA
jgi:hypothetical protein